LNLEPCDFREAVDIHDIPRFKQDPRIKELLRKGDTIGCFYVESPAMRMLLKKLKVDDYLGLVAASSIIRPGVAESGMMREYLLRHNDPERRKLAPKRLLEIMPETYGVMVYQEDVIRVVHLYGGLDLEESDTVRRGMNIRYRDRPEFKVVEQKFFANCKAFGYPPGEAEEVWRQIQSFASFSFAKGHSASYAVESYQSLYLKAHHPLEFLVGVANNFGGFYRTEFYLHEAKRAGAVIEAPCVNRSEELCSLVKDRQVNGQWRMANGGDHHTPTPIRHSPPPRIFLGLSNIKSLEGDTVQLILNERRRHGPFADLQDLLKRVPLGIEQARILIRVGALRFTGKSKPQLLWDLTLLHRPAAVSSDGDLFITRVEEPKLPDLQFYPLADAYDELELLGFPLCDPFSLVECGEWSVANGEWEMRAQAPFTNSLSPFASAPQFILKRDMDKHIGLRVTMLGYMIHVKTTTTQSGSYMSFGSFIDPAGDFWDSTQFPSVAERFPFRGRGVYRLTGVVEEEFGHCALRTVSMEKLPWKPDPRYGEK
jgi:DNA polymerase-3 subunit alpha